MTSTSTTSAFGASAEAYERLMGRWSRQLARGFAEFSGVADGERLLDVGCGTGSLTFALRELAPHATILGVDIAENYLAFARGRNSDPSIAFQYADACKLPFGDGAFDRVLSLLVLQFTPNPGAAISEIHRVVRPGGVAAACVWDNFGGMPHTRMLFDSAAVLGLDEGRTMFRTLTAPGELEAAWRAAGFVDVNAASMGQRFDYENFADYWASLAGGEGPPGHMVASLDPTDRERLRDAVRGLYLSAKPDGFRSFAATAWVCRGVRAA